MTASDVASLNEFPDVCEVIQLMSPSTAAASQDNLIDQVSLEGEDLVFSPLILYKYKKIISSK